MRSMRVLMVRTARRFNTDNGIRRATIVLKRYPKANAYGVFQYRQRYQEGYNYDGDHVQIDLDPFQYRQRYQEGYNDFLMNYGDRFYEFQYRQRYQEGYNSAAARIARLSALEFQYRQRYQEGYNFSKTVQQLLKAQLFQYRQRYQEGYNERLAKSFVGNIAVSIPTTVSGGLQ